MGADQLSKKLKYVTQQTDLSDLPMAPWLKDYPKEQPIYLIGKDDKELVLAVVALCMLGYNAMAAVEK